MSCLPFLWMLSSQHTYAPTDSLSGTQNLAFKSSTPQHLHKPSNHNRSEQSPQTPTRRQRHTQHHGVQPQQSTEAHLRLGAARPIKRGLHTQGGRYPTLRPSWQHLGCESGCPCQPSSSCRAPRGLAGVALRGIVSTYLGR